MRTAFLSIAALASILSALGAPANTPISKFAGRVKANSYIVKLKDGVSKDAHLNSLIAAVTEGSKVEYNYDLVFHGYAAQLRGKDLDYVRQSKDVEYIHEDGIATIQFEQGDEAEALKRSSVAKEPQPLAKRANGAGVVVYGIDSGINIAHSCFGGRASWGATFGGYADADGNGHGTHTAGTAVGTTYGVATSATIVAIKVSSDTGAIVLSDIISGVNYAYSRYQSSGKPGVAIMSIDSSYSTALNSAVMNAINGGLHFVAAAGNYNANAISYSPASVGTANTVGAVDSSNAKASFSNYGAVLDVWALGVNVVSAWIGSTTATATGSGTSMAAPRVAGILAVALGDYGNVTPASLSASLRSHAAAVVTGAPAGTVNLLAQRCNVATPSIAPARIATAVTAGAIDSSNRKASFSNYSSIADIRLLGINVLSAWVGNPTTTNTISGTSIAMQVIHFSQTRNVYNQITPAVLISALGSHARAIATGEPPNANLVATEWSTPSSFWHYLYSFGHIWD
ncbi:subtilisin-like protein [Ceratobasidium sp. AG-I]|nr:subtilisin-like protein [Ceratobasidium sp. AG-I]